jgi:hypothetical protein
VDFAGSPSFDHRDVGGPAKSDDTMIRGFLLSSANPTEGARCIARTQLKECAMKLSSAQVARTLSQFEAHAIPDDDPLVPQLNELFGDHTFFLDSNGLSVIELMEVGRASAGAREGMVVNLANWSDSKLTGLAPHEPEPTDIVVMLETEH